MGRIWGGILVIAGIGLWYYGGTSGVPYLVNLGIGTVILGLVVAALPMGGQVEKESLVLSCDPFCGFVGNLVEDLELKGNPVVIPPYENLPSGGVFIPRSKDFRVPLGKLDGNTVFLAGTEDESGVLIGPPPGRGIIDYTLENVGELSGTGIGYAASAVSSVLSALGLGSAEVFEKEDGEIEVFAKPLCGGPAYADPAVSAVLLGIAMGSGELLEVESVENAGEHVKVTLRRLGGVERWL